MKATKSDTFKVKVGYEKYPVYTLDTPLTFDLDMGFKGTLESSLVIYLESGITPVDSNGLIINGIPIKNSLGGLGYEV